MRENLPPFHRALRRFSATASQSLSSDVSSRPRYLNVSPFSSTWSHALNSVPDASRAAVAAIQWSLRSDHLLQISVPRCPAANSSRRMNISHWSHRGRGLVPSFRRTMVSSTFRCIKYIRSLGRLVALPGHPLIEQSIDRYVRGRAT